MGRVACAVVERGHSPGRSGSAVGDVHGVGGRVDSHCGWVRPDGDRRRCGGASGRTECVAGAGVDHRHGARAAGDVGGGDRGVGGQPARRRVGISGARCRQPLVVCALQRVASITETSLSTWLAVYSVWVCESRRTISGSAPVWISGGFSVPHPDGSGPLQRFVLITLSASSFWYTAYTVCKGASTVSQRTWSNPCPAPGGTTTVPDTALAQPDRSEASQSAQVKRRHRVVVIRAVQRVVRGVDLRLVRPDRIARQITERCASRLFGRVARVRVEHRPAAQRAVRGHVHGVGGLVHHDVLRSRSDIDGRRGTCRAGGKIGRVAGRAVDHRDIRLASVGDIHRVVGRVGEDPDRRRPDGYGRGRLPAARGVLAVAGGAVEHRHRVVARVRHVHRVGPLVDRDRAREVPDRDRRPRPLTARDSPVRHNGGCRSPRPCSRRRWGRCRSRRSRHTACASPHPARPRPGHSLPAPTAPAPTRNRARRAGRTLLRSLAASRVWRGSRSSASRSRSRPYAGESNGRWLHLPMPRPPERWSRS